MKKLYIDLDGVLIGKNKPDDVDSTIAKHTGVFLKYILKNYDCHWLTTHCRDGDNQHVLNRLSMYAKDDIVRLAGAIKPTWWKTFKTEAIDFESDFYWLDDAPLVTEVQVLSERKLSDRFIQVDTRNNPDDLKRVLHILKKYI